MFWRATLLRPNSWPKSLLITVTSTALPWDFYFFKLTQPLIVYTVQLLFTVKEKGGKTDKNLRCESSFCVLEIISARTKLQNVGKMLKKAKFPWMFDRDPWRQWRWVFHVWSKHVQLHSTSALITAKMKNQQNCSIGVLKELNWRKCVPNISRYYLFKGTVAWDGF